MQCAGGLDKTRGLPASGCGARVIDTVGPCFSFGRRAGKHTLHNQLSHCHTKAGSSSMAVPATSSPQHPQAQPAPGSSSPPSRAWSPESLARAPSGCTKPGASAEEGRGGWWQPSGMARWPTQGPHQSPWWPALPSVTQLPLLPPILLLPPPLNPHHFSPSGGSVFALLPAPRAPARPCFIYSVE